MELVNEGVKHRFCLDLNSAIGRHLYLKADQLQIELGGQAIYYKNQVVGYIVPFYKAKLIKLTLQVTNIKNLWSLLQGTSGCPTFQVAPKLKSRWQVNVGYEKF